MILIVTIYLFKVSIVFPWKNNKWKEYLKEKESWEESIHRMLSIWSVRSFLFSVDLVVSFTLRLWEQVCSLVNQVLAIIFFICSKADILIYGVHLLSKWVHQLIRCTVSDNKVDLWVSWGLDSLSAICNSLGRYYILWCTLYVLVQ